MNGERGVGGRREVLTAATVCVKVVAFFVKRIMEPTPKPKEYAPRMAHLIITDKCGNDCDHCFLGAPDGDTDMTREVVDAVVSQVDQVRSLTSITLMGGEPLKAEGIFWYALEKALATGKMVNIGSNGFWGSSEEEIVRIVTRINDIAAKVKGTVLLFLSVDNEHQKKVPISSIANIIDTTCSLQADNIRFIINTFARGEDFEQACALVNELEGRGYGVEDSGSGMIFDTDEGLIVCSVRNSAKEEIRKIWIRLVRSIKAFGKGRAMIEKKIASGEVKLLGTKPFRAAAANYFLASREGLIYSHERQLADHPEDGAPIINADGSVINLTDALELSSSRMRPATVEAYFPPLDQLPAGPFFFERAVEN